MNNKQNNNFFIFSAVTENEDYGKMLAKILNDKNIFLEKINKIFLSFKYGDKYKGVLITLYLGDFEYTPSISTPYLSNFSVKDKEWNFKIPVNEENIFIKSHLIQLENLLKKRKVKNFNFELFRTDIESL